MRWIITGPESTGKTALAEALAIHSGSTLIPEYAREYLLNINRPYLSDDLDKIANRQISEWESQYDHPQVFDTDILTTIIWHLEKYGRVPGYMLDHWAGQEGAIYLLCKADLPWEDDPLRENPHDRDRLFEIYFHYLNAYGKPFKVISGTGPDRIHSAITFHSKLEHK